MSHARNSHARLVLLAAGCLLTGCGNGAAPEAADQARSGGEGSARSVAATARELVYDREFLFIAPSSSPPLAIPWFFRSRAQVGEVQREQSVLVLRNGAWESLARESSGGPTTRTPWRILPGREVRVLVGPGDAIEALVLRSDQGEVETRPMEFLHEWTRPDGESVALFDARTELPSGPIPGLLLDISRRWEAPAGGPGDWMFLTAGTTLQIFLEEEPPNSGSRMVSFYRGWSRSEGEVTNWSGLVVRWDDMRSFERARRDVPYRWILSSPDDGLVGELVSVNTHLVPGEGEGPILPVTAAFGVSGSIRLGEREYAVDGVIRHVQR